MTEFDFRFEHPDPYVNKIQGLHAIGINLDTVRELTPPDARKFVRAVGAGWNKILRSGEGGEGALSATNSYPSLPNIAEINACVSGFDRLSDKEIKEILSRAPGSIGKVLEHHKAMYADAVERRQTEIGSRIEDILFPEQTLRQFNGSLLLNHSTPNGRYTYLACKDGKVIAGHSIFEQRKLYSQLTEDQREVLGKIRSDVDQEKVVFHVASAKGKKIIDYTNTKPEDHDSEIIGTSQPSLDEGWYELKNAVSKQDPTKKQPAAKLYVIDEEAISEARLRNAYLLGALQTSYRSMNPYFFRPFLPESSTDTNPDTWSLFTTLSFEELLHFTETTSPLVTNIGEITRKISEIVLAKPRGNRSAEHLQYLVGGFVTHMSSIE